MDKFQEGQMHSAIQIRGIMSPGPYVVYRLPICGCLSVLRPVSGPTFRPYELRWFNNCTERKTLCACFSSIFAMCSETLRTQVYAIAATSVIQSQSGWVRRFDIRFDSIINCFVVIEYAGNFKHNLLWYFGLFDWIFETASSHDSYTHCVHI